MNQRAILTEYSSVFTETCASIPLLVFTWLVKNGCGVHMGSICLPDLMDACVVTEACYWYSLLFRGTSFSLSPLTTEVQNNCIPSLDVLN